MNRGATSILCALMMMLMLASSVNYSHQLSIQKIAQESNQKSNHSNQSNGGYHIATGEWWSIEKPFNVSTNDWDGDGTENSIDPQPLDPAIFNLEGHKGTACTNKDGHCIFDPMVAPFRSDPVIINPVGVHSLTVAWGDINGDGLLDLVVGNVGSPNTLYLNNDGRIETTPTWSSQNTETTVDVELADVDGDGDLDLTELNYEGSARIYRNVGGTFENTPFWTYTSGNSLANSTMTCADWGDVDGDGYLDLVIGIYYQGIELFINNGNGIPSTPSWVRNAQRPTLDVELADINGDGYLDLIEGASNQKNQIYYNTGQIGGLFSQSPNWNSQDSHPTSSIALGDIDGDGDNDLVVGNRNEVNELYLNSGNSFANTPSWTSQNTSLTMDVNLADVDEDGDLDLLESTAHEPDYIFAFNGVDYGFEVWASREDSSGNHRDSSENAWGDVDGDGDLDFISADSNGPILYINGGHKLDNVAAWNDGTTEYTYSIDLGDMNNDGYLDLAVGNIYGGESRVYQNDGYNQFSLYWVTTPAQTMFTEAVIWFDVDFDGINEVILGTESNKNYAYNAWSGTSTGNNNPWKSNSIDDTFDLKSGDMNSDGVLDLVVLNDGANRIHYALQVPNGHYLSQQNSWSSLDNDFSVCGEIGDINGDGYLDLFVANYYGYAKVYLNTGISGNGELETTASWTSQNQIAALGCSLGDIDGDGDIDAILATESSGNILLKNNNGVLSKTADWTTPESDDTITIKLRDIDGDNDLDWIEGNYGFAKNRIRMNIEGDFNTTIWESSDNLDTTDIAIADIDGDGDLDMAVANEHQQNQIFISQRDQDGDWVSEDGYDSAPFDPTQINDFDGDGFGDRSLGWKPDDCPGYWGDSWRERWGCPDLDNDGQSDLNDPFMQQVTQWSDIDGDGLGDNWADPSLNSTREPIGLGEWVENAYLPDSSPWDYDNDGYDDENLDGSSTPFDDCPYQPGTSHVDRFGCSDADTDGRSDEGDAFPGDHTQWNDSDNDGFGDNSKGNYPDGCIDVAGTSTEGVFGCPDSDGDGWSDESDFDSDNPDIWSDGDGDGFDDQLSDGCLNDKGSSTEDRGGCKDYDRDGYSDPDYDSLSHPNGNADAFPFEGTQWRNQDGDGFGDNQMGFQPDSCPGTFGTSQFKIIGGEFVEWFGCTDQDNDGLIDEDDDCPLVGGTSTIDRFGCIDSDNDGYSDLNDDCELQAGDSSILFVACPDTDGDGIPDSIDPHPSDGLGSADDWDADGIINSEDVFPNDNSQWEDGDGDGLGDNPNGSNPDPLPNDKDNDGWPDANDSFIDNPNEWIDTDGDGIGDNTDTDDDGDGYSDIYELQDGTDPKDPKSHAIESWELMIPGTRIGLSWWDLIGVIAGVPLASWLAFGLVTRNRRVDEFEEELKRASTKQEIEEVAIRAERALMLRLLGPHQGIRLERLRAELDDALDVEGFPPTQVQTALVVQDMLQGHEPAFVPDIPDTSVNYQITESNGYEWRNEDGKYHYRLKDGDGVWHPWGE